MLRQLALLPVTCLLSAAALASGPDIADRVAGLGEGTVRMSFAARDGVCGDGRGSISVNGSWHCSEWHDDEWERDCDEGPVRVSLKVRDGEVVGIKTRVGGKWRAAGDADLDLGDVSPQDAADFFLELADNARESVAKKAILPAILARDVETWPRILEIARDDDRPEDVRESAVFWLGLMAGEKATDGLARLVADDDEDLDVRKTAVFALSQCSGHQNTRYLFEIARANPHPQLRKSALFWLAQRDEPEVLDFFEEILLGK